MEALHRHRPLVSAGAGEQVLVAATDSHVKPVAQPELQPPQWDSLVEMLTQVPPQQRLAASPPHEAPSARVGWVQTPAALHVSVVHAFPSSPHARPLWMVSVQVGVPLQARVMQGVLLQATVVPAHAPFRHVSP